MIDLGEAEFHLAIPSLSQGDLTAAASRLFDHWDDGARISLPLDDYSISLIVEEGSVKGLGKISASLFVLYIAIGEYGDFVRGLRTINEQFVGVRDYLTHEAPRVFGCPDELATARKRSGITEKLSALFARVQRGEMSAEDATRRAEMLVNASNEEAPDFMEAMAKAFRACPLNPRQSMLPFEEDFEELILSTPKPNRPGDDRPRRAPPVPLGNQFRIEVWRESKGKRKHTKVTRLK